jgi:predicted RecB family nuclease
MSGHCQVEFEHAIGELEDIGDLYRTDFPKLRKSGIRTVKDLAATSASTLSTILGRSAGSLERFPLLAQARLASKPVAIKPLSVPQKPRVYFDIETDPDGGNKLCWLIGVLDEASGEFVQFLAEKPVHEKSILQKFVKFCEGFGTRQLVSYSGSNFDHRNVITRMQAFGIAVPPPLKNAIDLLHPIKKAVALPCKGYQFKDVAACFGFTYRHPDLDGFTVAQEYLRLADRGKRIPRQLLEYNEDDVRALQHVVARVEELAGYERWSGSR